MPTDGVLIVRAKRRSELIWLSASDPDEATRDVAAELGIQFELHESSFWGEYSLHKGVEGFEVRIFRNRDPIDGELICDGASPEDILLEADGPVHLPSMTEQLSNCGIENRVVAVELY